MRNLLPFLLLLCLCSVISAQETPGVTATPEEKSDAETIQLSPEYLRLLRDAGLEFQRRNLDSALKILDQADAITLDTPVALNLRGAVYTEKKDYTKADDLFRKALERAPGYFAAEFNRGEVIFLQKKYAEARAYFEKMLGKFKDNELLQYKICLSHLQEKNRDKAVEWMEKIKFPSDSPAYYFANAALSFDKGDEADAIQWIASSERIFGPDNNLIFLESLADLGYVTRPKSDEQPDTGATLPKAGAGAE